MTQAKVYQKPGFIVFTWNISDFYISLFKHCWTNDIENGTVNNHIADGLKILFIITAVSEFRSDIYVCD